LTLLGSGSFVWKEKWAPKVSSSSSAVTLLRLCFFQFLDKCCSRRIRNSTKMNEGAIQGADRVRVKQAAKLEGTTADQAIERRKGFSLPVLIYCEAFVKYICKY
ncbi:hypothetical protein K435DRAFT_680237, partial [Dendrothele bispora CBS 962.96]